MEFGRGNEPGVYFSHQPDEVNLVVTWLQIDMKFFKSYDYKYMVVYMNKGVLYWIIII